MRVCGYAALALLIAFIFAVQFPSPVKGATVQLLDGDRAEDTDSERQEIQAYAGMELAEGRRGGALTSSGGFKFNSQSSNRAGNSEKLLEDKEDDEQLQDAESEQKGAHRIEAKKLIECTHRCVDSENLPGKKGKTRAKTQTQNKLRSNKGPALRKALAWMRSRAKRHVAKFLRGKDANWCSNNKGKPLTKTTKKLGGGSQGFLAERSGVHTIIAGGSVWEKRVYVCGIWASVCAAKGQRIQGHKFNTMQCKVVRSIIACEHTGFRRPLMSASVCGKLWEVVFA